MSGQYAKDTSVSVEKSRAEIETTLARYGAESFAYATKQMSEKGQMPKLMLTGATA